MSGRLPSVDGWRALSIMMVLAGHSLVLPGVSVVAGRVLEYFPLPFWDANLGVRFFFVISGFLITHLLLQEQERNGQISLKSFYIRRALRILPVYLAYLAMVAGLQIFTDLHQPLITWLGDLTFTINFLPRGHISGHLWSLSVEEQFYLLWPLTFIWLNRHRRWTGLVLAIPFIVAMSCHLVVLFNRVPWIVHPLFHFHSSLVNFDSLGMGCISAFVLARQEGQMRRWLAGRKHWLALLAGSLLIVLPSFKWPFLAPFWAVATQLFQALGFSIVLLVSVLFPGSFKPLNWPVVAGLGVISYSVYLWQQMVQYEVMNMSKPIVWWLSVLVFMLVSIGAGFISYNGFERPLLKLRSRFRTT